MANQAAFVKNSTTQLSPGEENPLESTPTPTASPSATGAAASSTSSSSGLSGGVIAGIVVGAVAVVALAGVAFYLCGRNRTLASVLRYSQPPMRSRPQNIPPIPYSPSPGNTPYSPEFSPKQAQSSPRPGLNPHDSWQTQSTTQPLRPTSPEMAGAGGMMSPQFFNPGYTNGGYTVVENPGNIAAYQGQPSPGSSPRPQHGGYSQVQYAQVPSEMAALHEPMSSPEYVQELP